MLGLANDLASALVANLLYQDFLAGLCYFSRIIMGPFIEDSPGYSRLLLCYNGATDIFFIYLFVVI